MELWVTAGAFLVSIILAASDGGQRIYARIELGLNRIAHRPVIAAILLLILALAFYALPSIWHVPVPVVHDEFSYVLAGDTFAHGRLSNPPHPRAPFFETFHILQSPTYMSKFPPATGLMLALGQILGLPIVGMWIASAVGAMAIFWMLRAAMPARWALLMSLLAAFHPTIIWFSQIYWGGGVALTGGALLGGAMLRTIRKPTAGMGFVAGLGVSLLAISRPFEGVLVTTACGFAVLFCSIRNGTMRSLLIRAMPMTTIAPAIAVGFLMYYHTRVTGSPFLMPYVLHTRQYMAAPLFFWQSPPALPNYPNEWMKLFHTTLEYDEFADGIGWPNYPLGMLNRIGMILWAYARPVLLLIPILAAVVTLRNRRMIRVSLFICLGVVLVHVTICPWMRIAYMAPLVGLMLLMVGLGMRRVQTWRWQGQPLGLAIVRALVVTHVAVGIYWLANGSYANARSVMNQRAKIVESLKQRGGEHLIIVRYGQAHSISSEWVYNGADIDSSPVIFARDLGEQRDQELLSYYSSRQVWMLDVTNRQIELKPLSADSWPITAPTTASARSE